MAVLGGDPAAFISDDEFRALVLGKLAGTRGSIGFPGMERVRALRSIRLNRPAATLARLDAYLRLSWHSTLQWYRGAKVPRALKRVNQRSPKRLVGVLLTARGATSGASAMQGCARLAAESLTTPYRALRGRITARGARRTTPRGSGRLRLSRGPAREHRSPSKQARAADPRRRTRGSTHGQGSGALGRSGSWVRHHQRASGPATRSKSPRQRPVRSSVIASSFKTLSLDNGTEFHDYAVWERRFPLTVYFAASCHAWKRGTSADHPPAQRLHEFRR